MNKEIEQITHCADVKLVLDFLFSECNVMKTALKDSETITESQKELLVDNSNQMKRDLEHLTSLLEQVKVEDLS